MQYTFVFDAITFWMLCAFFCAWVGHIKRESSNIGLLIGLLFGPLGVLLTLFMRTKGARCPYCREFADAQASVCPYCRSTLPHA